MSHLRWALCSLALLCAPIAATHVERRGVIDIGSGSVKLMISDVDTESNQIVNKIFENVLAVSMQGHLNRSSDLRFDRLALMECLAAVWLSKAQAKTYGTKQVTAIATAAFRRALNNAKAAHLLSRASGIPIQIIEQQEEARLGYVAARSKTDTQNDVIVWDLGGGSMQMSYIDPRSNTMTLYKGSLAAHTFKEQVLTRVKRIEPKPESSPNPLSKSEAKQARQLAKEEAHQVSQELRALLAQGNVTVLGIDAIHNRAIADRMGVTECYTKKGLKAHMKQMIGKSDEEIGGGPFSSLLLTDALLVYGFMEELGIDEVHPVDATISEGVLLSPNYWVNPSEH